SLVSWFSLALHESWNGQWLNVLRAVNIISLGLTRRGFRMKGLLCRRLDGVAALELADLPEPVPSPGEVIVAVRAAALNFFDTLITQGKYQHKPDLPFSPSGEIAGVVSALGPGVKDVVPGDRVMAYLGWGGARERIAVGA